MISLGQKEGQRRSEVGSTRDSEPLTNAVLDSLRVEWEEDHDSLTQQLGHSRGGARCGYIPSMRQLLGQNRHGSQKRKEKAEHTSSLLGMWDSGLQRLVTSV